MSEQQPTSPRQRQQELLAIPERQRTDEQWDELNELEIALASVNRVENREPSARRNGPGPGSASAAQQRPNTGAPGKKPVKRFHKRPPKPATP